MRDRETAPELIAIVDEINVQSDRGAAILIGSILSEFLAREILKKFNPTSNRRKAKLFDGFGPLASFSARIEIANSLDVISADDTYNDLTVIKDVRNEFAHSIEPMTFQSDQIKYHIKKLKNAFGNGLSGSDTLERRLFMQSVLECLLDICQTPVPRFS